MTAYYNENDPFAVQWLRNLIAAGLIAPGDVDERSIEDVKPDEIRKYTQCHFFAGIGTWSYALRQAGWDDNRRVWTGSCPCQPFSIAGKGAGFDDERHLWPAWFHLVTQCEPDILFGEQVASKDGLNWFDLVQTDLENAGFAVGGTDLCTASVGADHIRQRLYFVAERMGNTVSERFSKLQSITGISREKNETKSRKTIKRTSCNVIMRGNKKWIECNDRTLRPIEPGTFLLVDGITSRMGRLRAYGNSIVAPLAQAFIESYLECRR